MSKFMMIVGIVVVALGVALGLMVSFPASQATLLVYGLSMEGAILLLVGGLALIGIGGVIAASEQSARAIHDLRDWLAGHEGSLAPMVHHEAPAPAMAVPDYVPAPAPAAAAAAAVTSAAAAVVAATEKPVEVAKVTTADTIAALEKAKADISEALGSKLETVSETVREVASEPVREVFTPEPAPAAVVIDEPPPEDQVDDEDGDLFVVEEKTIRNRPARVLSDGTVEAETDEGWMRFENLEHLEEYLDAVSPQSIPRI